MSDEIKSGDLVIIIKAAKCCGYDKNVGKILTVAGLPNNDRAKCPNCGDIKSTDGMVRFEGGRHTHRDRLKKIPPLSDDESTDTRADLDKPVKEVV